MLKTSVIILALVAAASGAPRIRFARNVPVLIVGGQPTAPNEFPHMASLQYFGSHICGATITRSNVLLTAAHCAAVGPPESLIVKAGKRNIRLVEASEQTRNIRSIHIHPGYPGETGFSNDIAVLRTDTPFSWNDAVAPLPLSLPNHNAHGVAIIHGWGTLREGGLFYPSILQKAQVNIVTDSECRQAYGADQIDDSMICAGLPQGGVDSCSGDSVRLSDRGYRYLAGITSFGYGCARPGYPGVYQEISYHREFIDTHSSPHEWQKSRNLKLPHHEWQKSQLV